ncbi:MAG: PIN domain-containing protein [Alphaproteobacteria bacterium]|nr:PIN domain-containing protein [Alphaproteobacteria bacterium]MBV9553774.1 PIN domain-containing protein [Alphaproteobacteria bacterium]
MMLFDTNVLIDVIDNDPAWADWSQEQLDLANAIGEVCINDVVYAELSIGYRSPPQLDRMLTISGISVIAMPHTALFAAGRAFRRYRAGGGIRTGVLPDFFIGALAQTMNVPLVTRDPRRYRTYFPGIELIAPGLG